MGILLSTDLSPQDPIEKKLYGRCRERLETKYSIHEHRALSEVIAQITFRKTGNGSRFLIHLKAAFSPADLLWYFCIDSNHQHVEWTTQHIKAGGGSFWHAPQPIPIIWYGLVGATGRPDHFFVKIINKISGEIVALGDAIALCVEDLTQL